MRGILEHALAKMYFAASALAQPTDAPVALELDSAVATFWRDAFGPALVAAYDALIDALRAELKAPFTVLHERALHFVLDNSSCGLVPARKFVDFVRSFGPISECHNNVSVHTRSIQLIAQLCEIFTRRWFYGFLSSREAEFLLHDSKPGTFLVRFSKSRPGNYALAFVERNGVAHISVNAASSQRFFITEEGCADPRELHGFDGVIRFYADFLRYPLFSEIAFEVWFHGDASGDDAKELLANTSAGTFCLRLSSSMNCCVFSYLDRFGVLKHSLIENASHNGRLGFQVKPDSEVLPTLSALVNFYAPILQTALLNPQSELRQIALQCSLRSQQHYQQLPTFISTPRSIELAARVEGVLRSSREASALAERWLGETKRERFLTQTLLERIERGEAPARSTGDAVRERAAQLMQQIFVQ
jgi:hypothetical protein